jgi:mono/diheme cytochrome c family protein
MLVMSEANLKRLTTKNTKATTKATKKAGRIRRLISGIPVILAASVLLACAPDKSRMTDAQLHLTAEQADGRHIFNQYCAACHSAYSSKKLTGPPLNDLYHRRALPSGAPVTDDRVGAAVMRGRGMMPAFGDVLDDEQMKALLAYLHTL